MDFSSSRSFRHWHAVLSGSERLTTLVSAYFPHKMWEDMVL